MEDLNLPPYDFKIVSHGDGYLIWDEFRKKNIELTPEEWVRQHFLQFMHRQLGYPKALLKVEFGIKYNKRKKRPDIVAYDNSGNVFLIVECKSAKIKIGKDVFEQVSVYNKTLQAQYLVVTNGLEHYCCAKDEKTSTFRFVEKIPSYKAI
jgi:hypothetical protein